MFDKLAYNGMIMTEVPDWQINTQNVCSQMSFNGREWHLIYCKVFQLFTKCGYWGLLVFGVQTSKEESQICKQLMGRVGWPHTHNHPTVHASLLKNTAKEYSILTSQFEQHNVITWKLHYLFPLGLPWVCELSANDYLPQLWMQLFFCHRLDKRTFSMCTWCLQSAGPVSGSSADISGFS